MNLEKSKPQQLLLDFAIETIIERSKKPSLQKKVINMDVTHDEIGITWRNKDKSVFIMVFRINKDPRTKDLGPIEFATINYTEEEFKNIQL